MGRYLTHLAWCGGASSFRPSHQPLPLPLHLTVEWNAAAVEIRQVSQLVRDGEAERWTFERWYWLIGKQSVNLWPLLRRMNVYPVMYIWNKLTIMPGSIHLVKCQFSLLIVEMSREDSQCSNMKEKFEILIICASANGTEVDSVCTVPPISIAIVFRCPVLYQSLESFEPLLVPLQSKNPFEFDRFSALSNAHSILFCMWFFFLLLAVPGQTTFDTGQLNERAEQHSLSMGNAWNKNWASKSSTGSSQGTFLLISMT